MNMATRILLLLLIMIAAPGVPRCADFGEGGYPPGYGEVDGGDMGPSGLPDYGAPTRIKNIVSILGVRQNQLVGYGLAAQGLVHKGVGEVDNAFGRARVGQLTVVAIAAGGKLLVGGVVLNGHVFKV